MSPCFGAVGGRGEAISLRVCATPVTRGAPVLPDCADLRWISRGVDFALVPPPRFLYDGNRINDDDTPASLEMEDNGEHPDRPRLRHTLTYCRCRYD